MKTNNALIICNHPHLKYGLMAVTLLFSQLSHSLSADFTNYRSSIVIYPPLVSSQVAEISYNPDLSVGCYDTSPVINNTFSCSNATYSGTLNGSPYSHLVGYSSTLSKEECPDSVKQYFNPPNTQPSDYNAATNAFVNYINSRLPTNMNIYASTTSPGTGLLPANFYITGQKLGFTTFHCRDSRTSRGGLSLGVWGESFTPVNPPAAVCSLNNANINLSYSSTDLNVDGKTQSTSLYITCTTGNAQNYQLRLTGTNVANGRLMFGNGVSAQVSLNGTQVQANGSGISLNTLTSKTIPISATLFGTATSSGESNANGILVLESL